MQFAYQFPERLERLVLVDSGGLGNEVHVVLRAATLPGAELVMPLLFNSAARSAGRAVNRALAKIGVRGGADVRGIAEGLDSLTDAHARQAFLHTARSVIDPAGQPSSRITTTANSISARSLRSRMRSSRVSSSSSESFMDHDDRAIQDRFRRRSVSSVSSTLHCTVAS